MKRGNMNKYLVVANLSAFVYFCIGHLVKLPDFIVGFCIGISIAFYFIGLYAAKHDMSKLRSYKRKLICRLGRWA